MRSDGNLLFKVFSFFVRVPDKEVQGLVGQFTHLPEIISRSRPPGAEEPQAASRQGYAGVDPDVVKGPAESEPALWKRVLDITCIVVALPLLIPLMLVIALLIFVVSPGPIFYLQERVGYRGRRFTCIKFRTMKHKAEDKTHREHLVDLIRSNRPMTKMENDTKGDPRVIPLGGVLRSTGLDELPQLLNVLGGQMSLVGPRPCLLYEWENYLPEQKLRFESWPGLTGLWQVSGKNSTTFAEMVALDVEYAKTQSLKLDLWIMMRTFPVLTSQVREALARRRAQRRALAAVEPSPLTSPASLAAEDCSNRLHGSAELARYR